MKLFSIILASVFIALHAIGSFAQEAATPVKKPLHIGITGGCAYNLQTADFLRNDLLQLFRFPDREGKFPEHFRQGLGGGLYAGVLTTIPLDEQFSLSLRATAAQHNAELSTREVYPTRIGAGGMVDTASYSLHTLSMLLPSVGAEALAEWRIANTGLSIQAGFRAALLISPQFTYQERFTSTLSNAQGVFVGSGTVLRMPLGSEPRAIPQIASLQAHVLAGLGYEFALGEKLRIRPEAFYAFALTNAFLPLSGGQSEANSWALHQFRGGLTLMLPLPEAPPAAPIPQPDTVQYVPILAVKAFGLDTRNESLPQASPSKTPEAKEIEREAVSLYVQQTISRSVFPLLPYVFFDGVGSVTLPERYALLTKEQTSTFRESKLSAAYDLSPKEHSYYHVLNIIGERLRRMPKATLTVHGCTDGVSSERDKSSVAKSRAQVVVRYLTDVWNIEPQRLKLQETPLQPNTPSVPLTEAEKQAENRRVEMRSDTPALLEHITLLDTTRRVSPPSLRFYPTVTYRREAQNDNKQAVGNEQAVGDVDSVRSWRLTVRQADRVIKEFSGIGNIPQALDWRLDERELAALQLDEKPDAINPYAAEVEYRLSAETKSGQQLTSAFAAIPLETRINTHSGGSKRGAVQSSFAGNLIERFNLILFDFAKSAITSAQEPMMNLMKSRITPRSTVRVDGFTDRTGDAEFNRKLSLQRAQGVAQALGFAAELLKTNVIGYGSSVELYDNNLPEGRFYSRTVRVVVETPQSE